MHTVDMLYRSIFSFLYLLQVKEPKVYIHGNIKNKDVMHRNWPGCSQLPWGKVQFPKIETKCYISCSCTFSTLNFVQVESFIWSLHCSWWWPKSLNADDDIMQVYWYNSSFVMEVRRVWHGILTIVTQKKTDF